MADGLIIFCRSMIVFFVAMTCACAEEMADPTRPPANILSPVADAGVVVPKAAGLQSIIISQGRRAAIIDGETVTLGEQHGNLKLIEVNEGNVVLSGMHKRQVLTLFPDVKVTRKHTIQIKPSSSEGEMQPNRHTVKPVASKEEK